MQELERAYTILKKIGKGKLPDYAIFAKNNVDKNAHAFLLSLDLISIKDKSDSNVHAKYVLACESKLRAMLFVIDNRNI